MAFLLALLAPVMAAPTLTSLSSIAQPTAVPANQTEFFNLRTRVTHGCDSHDGLYVTTWHTGAGTADAALLPEAPTNEFGYLDGVQIKYQLGNISSSPPAYLRLEYEPYASWSPVTLDQAEGPMEYGGFYFNNTANDAFGRGLKFNGMYPQQKPSGNFSQGWGGWYACDWWHNVPQLFWIVPLPTVNANDTIKTCSKIELVREPISAGQHSVQGHHGNDNNAHSPMVKLGDVVSPCQSQSTDGVAEHE